MPEGDMKSPPQAQLSVCRGKPRHLGSRQSRRGASCWEELAVKPAAVNLGPSIRGLGACGKLQVRGSL